MTRFDRRNAHRHARTDAARIARLIPCQRRLLNDLALSATYLGTAATEEALRLCLDQHLVKTAAYARDTGRPYVRLTLTGERVQRKARGLPLTIHSDRGNRTEQTWIR